MRNLLVIGMVVGVVGLMAARAWGVGSDEIIGDQNGVVRSELGNGLEVVVVPTGGVSGGQGSGGEDVQVWLIVRAGSMYEDDQQRGAAMVIQRALVSGTAGFSGDEIDKLFESQGFGGGGRAGWFVGFDQAVYMGQARADDAQGVDRVLGFFGELLDADRWMLDDERVGRVVGELIKEIEEEPSAQMRSRARWLPVLMRGSLFGDRLPRARIEELEALGVEAVRGFGRAFYHPGQAVVLVVGDVDADVIAQQVDDAMGSIGRGPGDVMIDGRIKIDVSMRAVLDYEPGLEKHQGAMIWFRDRDVGVVGGVGGDEPDRWSDRAGRYSLGDARKAVIDRVAGEIVRHRLGRQSVEVFGGHGEVGVDQVDLFGQVDLLQIGIESSQGRWEDSVGFLVRQCDRLARDGATGDEVRRARRSLLSRWHRDADDWVGLSNRDRMGLVHWLVTTGRPMIDMVGWDRLATELMSGIRDEEIQQAVRELVDPQRACYVVLVPGEGAGQEAGAGDDGAQRVIEVVTRAMGSALEPIDPQWMEQLVDSLIDARPDGGEVEEVFQHEASGVWSAKLDNGIRVLSRSMGGDDGDRVYLAATLWGEVFGDGGFDDDEVLAGLIAWREPATESRGYRAIQAYLDEHGIEVAARQGDGHVQLRVDAPTGSFEQAMELMFVLLDRPMIERDGFERWQIECQQVGGDPVDEAIDALYGDGWVRRAGDAEISLDRAQRVLTQIVRNARIDIGIAGAIDGPEAIEAGAALFGALVGRWDDRDDAVRGAHGGENGGGLAGSELQAGGLGSERVIRVETDQEHGLAIGYVGAPGQDLRALRSMILSAMVLTDRMKQRGKAAGFGGSLRADIWTSDALMDRAFVLVRAWCEEEDFEQGQRVIDETIEGMVREGIGDDELARAQAKIDELIGRYFDTAGYWSVRMSMLGFHDRQVDDLWRIRQGYRAIDAQYATRVFGEVVGGNERFRVELVGVGR